MPSSRNMILSRFTLWDRIFSFIHRLLRFFNQLFFSASIEITTCIPIFILWMANYLCILGIILTYLGYRINLVYCWIQFVKVLFKIFYIYFCFLDYTKAFHCVDHNKLWKILKEMGISDYQTTWSASWEICRQEKKQQNWTWNNRLVQNWERSMWNMYIVTVLI